MKIGFFLNLTVNTFFVYLLAIRSFKLQFNSALLLKWYWCNIELYLAIQFCIFGKVVLMQYEALSCNTIPHFCKSSIDAIGSFILQYKSALLVKRYWYNRMLYLAIQFCTFGKAVLMQKEALSYNTILHFC